VVVTGGKLVAVVVWLLVGSVPLDVPVGNAVSLDSVVEAGIELLSGPRILERMLPRSSEVEVGNAMLVESVMVATSVGAVSVVLSVVDVEDSSVKVGMVREGIVKDGMVKDGMVKDGILRDGSKLSIIFDEVDVREVETSVELSVTTGSVEVRTAESVVAGAVALAVPEKVMPDELSELGFVDEPTLVEVVELEGITPPGPKTIPPVEVVAAGVEMGVKSGPTTTVLMTTTVVTSLELVGCTGCTCPSPTFPVVPADVVDPESLPGKLNKSVMDLLVEVDKRSESGVV
jgi:hypothetical protein